MILGLGDLLTSDQKPHISLHQVLRASAPSRIKLSHGELRGGQALLGSFFTGLYGRLIVPSAIRGIREQRCE